MRWSVIAGVVLVLPFRLLPAQDFGADLTGDPEATAVEAAPGAAAFPALARPAESVAAAPVAGVPVVAPFESFRPTATEGSPGLFEEGETDSPGLFERLMEKLFGLVPAGDPGSRDKLKLTLGTNVGYDTNVLYSPVTKIGSGTASGTAELEYKFGSRRLQLEAQLAAGVTYYDNRPGDDSDQNIQLVLGLDYRLTPRTTLSFDTNTAYLSQPNPQFIGGIQQYAGSYIYTNTSFEAQYMLRPRLGVGVGLGVNGFRYEDELINQNSGYFQENFSLSANLLVSPRSTLVFSYRYNPVQYYQSGLGSEGHYVTVGLEQNLTRRFSSSLTGGAEYRQLKSTLPGARTSYLGPFVEGNLVYEISPSFNIKGNLRFGTEPSGVATVAIRQTFRLGLSAAKTFGSHLETGLAIFYSNDSYDQPGSSENFVQQFYTTSLDVRYKFTRSIALALHSDYTSSSASTPDSAYDRLYTTLGLQFIF